MVVESQTSIRPEIGAWGGSNPDKGPTKVGHKAADEKQGYHRFYVPLRGFRWRMRMLRPSLVCVPCEGIGCPSCGNKGWLTVEETETRLS